jgi:hypothetical protein
MTANEMICFEQCLLPPQSCMSDGLFMYLKLASYNSIFAGIYSCFFWPHSINCNYFVPFYFFPNNDVKISVNFVGLVLSH